MHYEEEYCDVIPSLNHEMFFIFGDFLEVNLLVLISFKNMQEITLMLFVVVDSFLWRHRLQEINTHLIFYIEISWMIVRHTVVSRTKYNGVIAIAINAYGF